MGYSKGAVFPDCHKIFGIWDNYILFRSRYHISSHLHDVHMIALSDHDDYALPHFVLFVAGSLPPASRDRTFCTLSFLPTVDGLTVKS